MLATMTNADQTMFSAVPLNTVLIVLVLLLGGLIWHHARRVRRLERQLLSQHRFFRRELKMVNQGAIGLGQRVRQLERQVKRDPSVFDTLLQQQQSVSDASAKDAKSEGTEPVYAGFNELEPNSTKTSKPAQSRAEQSLANWLQGYQDTA